MRGQGEIHSRDPQRLQKRGICLERYNTFSINEIAPKFLIWIGGYRAANAERELAVQRMTRDDDGGSGDGAAFACRLTAPNALPGAPGGRGVDAKALAPVSGVQGWISENR